MSALEREKQALVPVERETRTEQARTSAHPKKGSHAAAAAATHKHNAHRSGGMPSRPQNARLYAKSARCSDAAAAARVRGRSNLGEQY